MGRGIAGPGTGEGALFRGYLRARAGVIAVCTITAVLFASVYLLFDVPAVAVVYPLILSALVLTVAGAFDYSAYARRHRSLAQGQLPAPRSQLEEDYQQIIRDLKEEARRFRLQASEEYNDMIDYYTTWAHQIKTPIAAMRLNLQAEDSDLARQLSGDLNRIETYVEMVLAYLRLDAASTDYLIREQELDEIIRPAIRRFSREFIQKKLTMEFTPTGYTVLTDEKWLGFVIEQVISNAVKYTSQGGVRIYMDQPGRLRIEDTGVGISADDLPRIFEKGYTGFRGREDRQASGIGLYLCRRITDNLGHGISAESRPGAGTKITLDLRRGDLGVE